MMRPRIMGSAAALSRRAALGTAAAGLAMPALMRRAWAQDPVHLISHRYPALEYYADKMRTAVPGVELDARLMPSGDAMQLQRIALSSRGSGLDLLWVNSISIANYAKNGWLEPLDELWEKHREEFALDDINPASIRGVTYDGKIYAMPLTTNVLLYAHRRDLLEEAGLALPKTWEEGIAVAQALDNPPMRSGTTLALKWDMTPHELQAVMNTVGEGWFDADWRPIFHKERGAAAVETYRRLAKFAVPGYTAQGNDENAINFGQDVCAVGQQWATRCASMDDPAKSRVTGLIEWANPPGGKQSITTDGYAISRFSGKDKDTLFRVLAGALSEQNQRGAAALATPPRRAVLNDPAVQKEFRWYPAVSAAFEVAEPLPNLPEFNEAAEIATKRMVQAIVEEQDVQKALDTAAAEVTDLLGRRGYYQ